MHVIDFHAVGNGDTCDDNHPHVPFFAYRKEAEKVSVLGRHELISGSPSGRLCPVWQDEV